MIPQNKQKLKDILVQSKKITEEQLQNVLENKHNFF